MYDLRLVDIEDAFEKFTVDVTHRLAHILAVSHKYCFAKAQTWILVSDRRSAERGSGPGHKNTPQKECLTDTRTTMVQCLRIDL